MVGGAWAAGARRQRAHFEALVATAAGLRNGTQLVLRYTSTNYTGSLVAKQLVKINTIKSVHSRNAVLQEYKTFIRILTLSIVSLKIKFLMTYNNTKDLPNFAIILYVMEKYRPCMARI